MNALITALVALTTPIDPKVRLELQQPRAGSNQWPQVVFNAYCYEKLGDASKTETRTRAMAHLFGQAAQLLAKDDASGSLSIRTFYRAQDGTNTPRLHIVVRPESTASAPAMDANAELARVTEQAASLGFDFSTVPSAISGNTAAYVGFLKAAVAKLGSATVNAEVTSAAQTSEAPPL
jgi:hypothetical protein